MKEVEVREVKVTEGQNKELKRLEDAAAADCPGWRMCYRNHKIKDKCDACSRLIEFLRGV